MIFLLMLFFTGSRWVLGDTNIAPLSQVAVYPYVGSNALYVTDGVVLSSLELEGLSGPLPIKLGREIKQKYYFSFPTEVVLTRVRLYQLLAPQRSWASAYRVLVDFDGDRHCDATVVSERDAETEHWFEYKLSLSRGVKGVCIEPERLNKAPGVSYGGPVFSEVELYSRDSISRDIPMRKDRGYSGPSIEFSSTLEPFPRPRHDSNEGFGKGVFASMWYFWNPNDPFWKKRAKSRLERLKALGVNRLWLYPSSYINPLKGPSVRPLNDEYTAFLLEGEGREEKVKVYPFPSDFMRGSRDDIFSQFTVLAEAFGIDVIVNEGLYPYSKGEWSYPRVPNPDKYPSLCSEFIEELPSGLYREFVQHGAKGIVLGGDEFFVYQGVDFSQKIPPLCYREGKIRESCLSDCRYKYFQWLKSREGKGAAKGDKSKKVFQYKYVSRLFDAYSQEIKRVRPSALTTTLLRPAEQNRIGYGVAYDVVGEVQGLDELSSDPYWYQASYLGLDLFANEVRKLRGAAGTKRVSLTLQTTPDFSTKPFGNQIMLYGPAFEALMSGVGGLSFYKFDYLGGDRPNQTGETVKKIFRLVDYLQSIGFHKYSEPKGVGLIYSRASEDWWQMDNKETQDSTFSLAHASQNGVIEILHGSSIPFDLFYLDQDLDYEVLKEYKVLLVPFLYSVSKKNAQVLRRLEQSGVPVYILAENDLVDEFGKASPYRAKQLGEVENISFKNRSFFEAKDDLLGLFEKVPGWESVPKVMFESEDVRCRLLETVDRKAKLLFCINWTDASQVGEVRVGQIEEATNIKKIDLEGIRKARGVGTSGTFQLRMEPYEAFVLQFGGV